jgi:DNA invertase Pin-like site-specific DNA recombinase
MEIDPRENAIVYCRVSSERQKLDGVSLEAQEKLCLEHCTNKGYNVVEIIKETASAKDIANQVKLREVYGMVGVSVLVVYNVSRFSRNVSQGLHMYQKLRDSAIRLESVMENLTPPSSLVPPSRLNTDTQPFSASSDFVFVSLLNAAEYELKLISQRASLAVRTKRERGFQFGKVPYGMREFRDDQNVRRFEEEPYEAKVVKFIRAVRGCASLNEANILLKDISKNQLFEPLVLDDEGYQITTGLPCDNIAEILNDYGVDYRGKSWTRSAVYSVSSR